MSSDVQRRLVTRWCNTARNKVATTPTMDPADRDQLERAIKRMQIMESSIKAHRSWVYRSGDLDRAINEFENAWGVLVQFASTSPIEPIRSPFMWNVRLQVLALLNRVPLRLPSLSNLSGLSPLSGRGGAFLECQKWRRRARFGFR